MKKVQKQPLIGLLFSWATFLAFACSAPVDNAGENKAVKDSLEAIKVLDTVSHLPEVADRKKLIEGNSEGRRNLSTWIAEKPGKFPFYEVAVGEEAGKTKKGLHFNFRVYPASMRIVLFDELNQKEITLEEWRTQNK